MFKFLTNNKLFNFSSKTFTSVHSISIFLTVVSLQQEVKLCILEDACTKIR
jgi:hypothetical protein